MMVEREILRNVMFGKQFLKRIEKLKDRLLWRKFLFGLVKCFTKLRTK